MVRVMVASVIYGSIIAFYLAQSGAPTRVHVATAASLAIGFLAPALVIGSLREFVSRWKLVICAALVGTVVFDLLTSVVVAKAEFLSYWYLKYPALFAAFGALLLLHATVSGVVARRVTAA